VTILALHGFTQRGTMWAEMAAEVGGEWLTPDLPGHGAEPPVPWEAAAARLQGLLAVLPRPRILAGYSMGGRMALAVALAAPDAVDGLVLISASAGIADGAVRARRREEDARLAGRIRAIGVEAFVDEWLARPMFAGLGRRDGSWREADRRQRVEHHGDRLAGALESLGPGAQPPLGNRLGELAMPVLLVAGADDEAYAARARAMAGSVANGRAALVDGAGHAVVGERPEAVAAILSAWLADTGLDG
jgi:2-succinyl-6-hydroxy-2,4-cyclohexadiene-1-carboxylate synthase